jgi:hypothetical protein
MSIKRVKQMSARWPMDARAGLTRSVTWLVGHVSQQETAESLLLMIDGLLPASVRSTPFLMRPLSSAWTRS